MENAFRALATPFIYRRPVICAVAWLLALSLDLCLALFVATPRACGVQLNRGGRRAWESHPSEDLSELPPLRDPCGAITPQALWLDRSTSANKGRGETALPGPLF